MPSVAWQQPLPGLYTSGQPAASDWQAFKALRFFPNSYRLTLVATFLLTVVFDLTVAVQVGLVMSCLFFIFRMAALTRIESVRLPDDVATLADGRAVSAWRLYGTLFFGSVSKLDAILPALEAEIESIEPFAVHGTGLR